MRNKIAALAIGAGLLWGLEQVVVSPLETGAVYPEYSSLRSDPMGALALYESLSKVTRVERLYKSRMSSDPGPGTTIFVLGVDPVSWAHIDEDTLKDYETLTAKGARLVIAFLPVAKPWAVDKEDRPVEKHWHIRFKYKNSPAEPGDVPRETALEFVPGSEWKKIAGGAIERKLGAGTVVLLADSYPLSNEGLREQKDSALILQLAGSAHQIVFDENHFGVVETGSITKLMRKYRLEGALAMLMLVAGLFLWRSASSLLPSRAPQAERAVLGRDSLEGMTALLRRGIAEQDLVRVCLDEWKKTAANDRVSFDRIINDKDAVSAYRAIQKALVEKT